MVMYIGFSHLLQVMDGLSTTWHSSALLLLMESFQTQASTLLFPSEHSTEVGASKCKQCWSLRYKPRNREPRNWKTLAHLRNMESLNNHPSVNVHSLPAPPSPPLSKGIMHCNSILTTQGMTSSCQSPHLALKPCHIQQPQAPESSLPHLPICRSGVIIG